MLMCSGRKLYQNNEDDFFIKVLIVNNLYLYDNFTRNQTEAFLFDSFS